MNGLTLIIDSGKNHIEILYYYSSKLYFLVHGLEHQTEYHTSIQFETIYYYIIILNELKTIKYISS